jgi:hypothetical protein
MLMDRMIAFCGVVCTDCPAYLATQANDHDALEQVLAHWREEFNAPDIAVEDIMCDGCLTSDGRLNGYCQHCEIRPCGVAQGVTNCAYCDEYACDKLERLLGICDRTEGFFGFARQARATLDGIRAELVT